MAKNDKKPKPEFAHIATKELRKSLKHQELGDELVARLGEPEAIKEMIQIARPVLSGPLFTMVVVGGGRTSIASGGDNISVERRQ